MPLLVEGINESVNRTIGMKPVDVNKENQHEVFMTLYGKPVHFLPPKFHVGDLVRVAKYASVLGPKEKRDKEQFRKGHKSNFEKEVYKISKVSRGDPNMYQLVDHEDGDKPVMVGFTSKSCHW